MYKIGAVEIGVHFRPKMLYEVVYKSPKRDDVISDLALRGRMSRLRLIS